MARNAELRVLCSIATCWRNTLRGVCKYESGHADAHGTETDVETQEDLGFSHLKEISRPVLRRTWTA